MKKVTCLVILIIAWLAASGISRGVSYNGINYLILDEVERTCMVVILGNNAVVPGTDVTNLVIPSTIKDENNVEYKVIEIGPYSFQNLTGIKTVTLPSTLKSIKAHAFEGCSGLAPLTLPDNLVTIEEYAFNKCSALSKVDFNKSLVEVGNYAFFGCPIRWIELPNTIKRIGDHAFDKCAYVESLLLPESLVDLGISAFGGCTRLKTVVLPSSITNIPSYAFSQCSQLQNVTISSKVTAIGDYAFCECSVLDNIQFPSTLLEIGRYAFSGCRGLQTVVLPESMNTIGKGAFSNCRALISINIPRSLTRLEDDLFSGCTSMTTIGLSEKIMEIGTGCFKDCTSLTAIQLPQSLSRILNNAFNGCKQISEIVLPQNLVFLGSYAFSGCTSLKHIELPESMYEIPSGLLFGCSALKSITLPKRLGRIDPESFKGCVSLEKLEFPETLTSIYSNAFQGCTGLTTLSFPESLSDIGIYAFEGCNGVLSIKLSSRMNVICACAFGGMTSLRAICFEGVNPSVQRADIFATVQNGSADASVYQNVLLDMPNCKLQDIQNNVPWKWFKNVNAYDGVLPPPVYQGREIEYNGIIYEVVDEVKKTVQTRPGTDLAHPGNNLVGALIIPSEVKEWTQSYTVVGVGKYGFSNLSELTSMVLPESITNIGEYAFAGCDSIQIIHYYPDAPIGINDNVFSTLSYSNALLEASKISLFDVMISRPWGNFVNIRAKTSTIPVGTDFTFKDVTYTVTDMNTRKCTTKSGTLRAPGSVCRGRIEIPAKANLGLWEYTVTGIGEYGFSGNEELESITISESVTEFGYGAFADCPNLAAIWYQRQGSGRLPLDIIGKVDNPNRLLYVNSSVNAPEGIRDNVIIMESDNIGFCENLILEAGYPFLALHPFTAKSTLLTKDFTQQTPMYGNSGWESIVVPFDVHSIKSGSKEISPMKESDNPNDSYSCWLYEGDAAGDWKISESIKAGVPYLIAMPNSSEFDDRYNISGIVSFMTEQAYVPATENLLDGVTWSNGRQFKPLWLKIKEDEAQLTLGLNAGVYGLTDNSGAILLPGSSFHEAVTPKPMEGYVTRQGNERFMPIHGDIAKVKIPVIQDNLLIVRQSDGVVLTSINDQIVRIVHPDGTLVKLVWLRRGDPQTVLQGMKGIFIINNIKYVI